VEPYRSYFKLKQIMGHYYSEMCDREESKYEKEIRIRKEKALEKLQKVTKMTKEELKDAFYELGFKRY